MTRWAVLGLAALVAALCAAVPASAAPGEIDPSFGDGGFLFSTPPDPNSSRVAIDDAGRILLLTNGVPNRVLRFGPDGAPDPSFGASGSAMAPPGAWRDMAVAPDGSILLAGSGEYLGRSGFEIARISAEGAVDASFGDNGVAHVFVDPGGLLRREYFVYEELDRIEVQPNGSPVAIGNARVCTTAPKGACENDGSAVIRLTPDGRPDPGFGTAGVVPLYSRSATPYNVIDSRLESLALAADGTILAGGTGEGMVVYRLAPNGAVDTNFGVGGKFFTKLDAGVKDRGFVHLGEARAIAIQPSGRIVLVGEKKLIGIDAAGRLDRSFGKRGTAPLQSPATTRLRLYAIGAATDRKGRLLVVGSAPGRVVVARFFPNGRHDPRFGGDGLAAVALSRFQTDAQTPFQTDAQTPERPALGMALAPDGSLVAGASVDDRDLAILFRLRGGNGRLARCHGRPAVLQGTPGPDKLRARGPIVAFGGDDRIRSLGGPVCAGPGDDSIRASGRGAIFGGPGDDRIVSGHRSSAHGGPGDDVLLPGGHDNRGQTFFGEGGADLLLGRAGPDRLFGGPGPDRLFGGGGRDLLRGGPGNDLLRGGPGWDRVVGGGGHDRFRPGATARRG